MSSNTTVTQLSNILLDLSKPIVGDQDTKIGDPSQPHIFQWRQSYNIIGGYPIRSEHVMLLGDIAVLEFNGRLLFYLRKRQILFQMDDSKVLNVTADLDQVMVNATKASER